MAVPVNTNAVPSQEYSTATKMKVTFSVLPHLDRCMYHGVLFSREEQATEGDPHRRKGVRQQGSKSPCCFSQGRREDLLEIFPKMVTKHRRKISCAKYHICVYYYTRTQAKFTRTEAPREKGS